MTRPRHVLVLVCDQLRSDFLRAYGCAAIPTPHVDWLAAQGVTFARAITQSPVCGPARASMASGRHVRDHGAWTNDVPLRPGVETIAPRMAARGYRTGAFGKLHSVPVGDPQGFEEHALFEEDRLGEDEPYLQWLRARRPGPGGVFRTGDLESQLPTEEHYEHWIATRAIEFVEGARADGRPTFTWVSFQGPHSPYDPPREFRGTVDERALPRPIAPDHPVHNPLHRYRRALNGAPDRLAQRRLAYAEMIAHLDHEIGRLLAAYERVGLLDDTTIVFTSDHGDLLGDYGFDKKGPYAFPANLNIPLIVANDPRVGRGLVTDALAGNLDVAGTALDVAGDPEPLGVSRSLLDLAQPAPRAPRDVLFSEYGDAARFVEDARWRYAFYPFLDRAELFDLQDDPLCLRDLAGRPEHAAREVAFLRRLLEQSCMADGPRINAFELVPDTQARARSYDPRFEDHAPLAFPMSAAQRRRVVEAGLDADFNEFCRGREVLAHYGLYWDSPRRTPALHATNPSATP